MTVRGSWLFVQPGLWRGDGRWTANQLKPQRSSSSSQLCELVLGRCVVPDRSLHEKQWLCARAATHSLTQASVSSGRCPSLSACCVDDDDDDVELCGDHGGTAAGRRQRRGVTLAPASAAHRYAITNLITHLTCQRRRTYTSFWSLGPLDSRR